MPKMKTKSGAKKRFRATASGKIRGSAAFLSHNLRRRSQKMKRQARGTMILHDADARIVRKFSTLRLKKVLEDELWQE